MRAWKRRSFFVVPVAALVFALGVLAAGCGGDDEETQTNTATGQAGPGQGQDAIRLAILSDCEGAFAPFYEVDIGGAQVPLLERGAKKKGEKPSDGIENAAIAGRKVNIVGYGCADDTADKAIEETRRLMEELNADILIGPLSGDEGIAVANYAKNHPDKTFINGTSGAQDTTLKVRAPNFFRFHTDGAQWSAGLGDYAYNRLGWRNAVIIGDDYSFPYTSLAGFVAEFCAIGGKVTKRIWPALGEKDYSSFIAQIPRDVDGMYVGIGGTGLITFLKQYNQQRGGIDPKKVMGNVFWGDPVMLKELGNRVVGVVTANETAGDANTPAAQAYFNQVKKWYPKDVAPAAASVFAYNYWVGMQALIRGLEAVEGDISDQKKLQQALAKVTINGPFGFVKLDENRQAIAPNYVQQIVRDRNGDQIPDVKTILKIPNVDQKFGGFFTENTPAPDRNNPKCVKRTPPAWVGKAQRVNYGS